MLQTQMSYIKTENFKVKLKVIHFKALVPDPLHTWGRGEGFVLPIFKQPTGPQIRIFSPISFCHVLYNF